MNTYPQLPHAFWGSATVNGRPVAVGEQIEGRGPGVRYGIQANPLSVVIEGRYGGPRFWEEKLLIQGSSEAKTPIQLFVAGVPAQIVAFEPGAVTQLDLVAEGEPVPPPSVPNWYIYDFAGQCIMADPPDAPQPTPAEVQKLLGNVYGRVRTPPQWQYIKDDDMFLLGQALGLGRPLTNRWTEPPWGYLVFDGGVLIKSVGAVL